MTTTALPHVRGFTDAPKGEVCPPVQTNVGLSVAMQRIAARFDYIKARVDAGEGFKPVVRSLGFNNTTAKKYAELYHAEWRAAVATRSHLIGGRTRVYSTKDEHNRWAHCIEATSLSSWCELLEKVYRYRNGRAKSLRHSRKLRKLTAFRTLKEKKARTAERFVARYQTDEAFRKKNRKKVLAYKKNHPERNRHWGHVRRAKIKSLPQDTAGAIEQHLKLCVHRCYWCGMKLPSKGWHMDHVIPIAKGGSHTAGNIVKACAMCNSTKTDKHPNDYVKHGQMVLL